MDLEFSSDELELRENVRAVLAAECPPSFVRSVFEGKDTAGALWERMTELYWPALPVAEAVAGLGRSFVAVTIVAEELGRAVARGPFGARAEPLRGSVRTVIDPTLRICAVARAPGEGAADRVPAEPGAAGVAGALTRVLEQATVAVAASTVGACRRIFEMTLDYA